MGMEDCPDCDGTRVFGGDDGKNAGWVQACKHAKVIPKERRN